MDDILPTDILGLLLLLTSLIQLVLPLVYPTSRLQSFRERIKRLFRREIPNDETTAIVPINRNFSTHRSLMLSQVGRESMIKYLFFIIPLFQFDLLIPLVLYSAIIILNNYTQIMKFNLPVLLFHIFQLFLAWVRLLLIPKLTHFPVVEPSLSSPLIPLFFLIFFSLIFPFFSDTSWTGAQTIIKILFCRIGRMASNPISLAALALSLSPAPSYINNYFISNSVPTRIQNLHFYFNFFDVPSIALFSIFNPIDFSIFKSFTSSPQRLQLLLDRDPSQLWFLFIFISRISSLVRSFVSHHPAPALDTTLLDIAGHYTEVGQRRDRTRRCKKRVGEDPLILETKDSSGGIQVRKSGIRRELNPSLQGLSGGPKLLRDHDGDIGHEFWITSKSEKCVDLFS